jgi:hypothetical protein
MEQAEKGGGENLHTLDGHRRLELPFGVGKGNLGGLSGGVSKNSDLYFMPSGQVHEMPRTWFE